MNSKKTTDRILHITSQDSSRVNSFMDELIGYGMNESPLYGVAEFRTLLDCLHRNQNKLSASIMVKGQDLHFLCSEEIDEAIEILRYALPENTQLLDQMQEKIREKTAVNGLKTGILEGLCTEDLITIIDHLNALFVYEDQLLEELNTDSTDGFYDILLIVLILNYLKREIQLRKLQGIQLTEQQQNSLDACPFFVGETLSNLILGFSKLLSVMVDSRAMNQIKLSDFYDLFCSIEQSKLPEAEQLEIKKMILSKVADITDSHIVSAALTVVTRIGYVPRVVSHDDIKNIIPTYSSLMKKMKPLSSLKDIQGILINTFLLIEFLPNEKKHHWLKKRLQLDKTPQWIICLNKELKEWPQVELNIFLNWVSERVRIDFSEIGIKSTEISPALFIDCNGNPDIKRKLIKYLKALQQQGLIEFETEFLSDLFIEDNIALTANFTGNQCDYPLLVEPFTNNDNVFRGSTNSRISKEDIKVRIYRSGKYDRNAANNYNLKDSKGTKYKKIAAIQGKIFTITSESGKMYYS